MLPEDKHDQQLDSSICRFRVTLDRIRRHQEDCDRSRRLVTKSGLLVAASWKLIGNQPGAKVPATAAAGPIQRVLAAPMNPAGQKTSDVKAVSLKRRPQVFASISTD